MNDWPLLREYVDQGSEAAFAELVREHLNLVYSTALRRLGNSHAAEEVTQSVFCLLAAKARHFDSSAALVSWLYQTASFKALKYLRGELRRRRREQEALMMNSTDPDATQSQWEELAPLLDDAMNDLVESDRRAILLRFFARKPLREIGDALGIGEDAARMRVNRALDKLRELLLRKGAACSTIALAGLLAERAVEAAPNFVVQSVQAAALSAAKASPSLFALLAVMTKSKLQSLGLVGIGLVVGFTAALLLIVNQWQQKPVPPQGFAEAQSRNEPQPSAAAVAPAEASRDSLAAPPGAKAGTDGLEDLRTALFAPSLERAYPSRSLIMALQALGPNNAALAVPLLIEALQSEGTNVQRRAASLLEYLAGAAKNGRWPRLLDPPSVGFAWESIDGGALQNALVTALPALREKMRASSDFTVLHPALRAATAIHSHPDLLPDVLEAMKTLQKQQASISYCVEAFARHPADSARLLQPLLNSPDEGVRIAAAACYAGLPGSTDSPALTILSEGLGKNHGDLQILDALKKFGADARPCLPTLLERAQFIFRDDGSSYVWELKDRYCNTLMAIDPELRFKIPELEQWHQEQEQLNLLKARVSHPSVTIPELTAALEHRETRYDALKRLGDLGPAAAEALPALREALKQAWRFAEDSDAFGSRAVGDAIRRIEPAAKPGE